MENIEQNFTNFSLFIATMGIHIFTNFSSFIIMMKRGYAGLEFTQIHEFFVIYNNDGEWEDMPDWDSHEFTN